MPTAIVLGTFDGLHKGHRAVIKAAQGFYTVAVTFDIPPKSFLGHESKLLMMAADKAKGLKTLGVDEIYTLDFSKVSNMSPEDFFCDIVQKFSPSLFVCGFNYRFGKGAAGDAKLLSKLCKDNGIEIKIVNGVGSPSPISSSAIREMVASGNVDKANGQIYGGFGFTSPVLHGDARGRILGFPTINQAFPEGLAVPKFGVYESRIIIDNEVYKSITNLGVRPTYKTDFIGCETFINGFSGEIYGKPVTLKLIKFIRPERKFSSTEELLTTVKSDIKSVLGIEL